MPRELLARCGSRCDLCLAYRENVEKEDRRKLLSDGWYKYFGFRIEPENIVACDGCLSDDSLKKQLLDTECPVRPCVIEKGYENCSQCTEFMCEKFKQRLADYEGLKKDHGDIPQVDYELFIRPYENGRRISELRAENNK